MKKKWFRTHKYNAKRTEFAGMAFPSQLEASVYALLKLLESQGEITEVMRYPSVRLEMACDCGCQIDTGITYKPDFRFTVVRSGEHVWVEAKGVETADFRKNVKLWQAGFGPGRLQIYKAKNAKVYLAKEIG